MHTCLGQDCDGIWGHRVEGFAQVSSLARAQSLGDPDHDPFMVVKMRPFIGNGIVLAFPALSQAEERVSSLHDGLVQLQLGEPLPLPLSSSKKSVPSKIPDLPTRQSFQIFSFPCKLQFDVDIHSTFSLTPATTDTTQAAGRALQSCIDARPRRRGRLHLDRTECRLECGCGAAETSANRLLLLFSPPSPSLTRHPAGTGRLRARADDATSLARVSSLDSRCVEATAKLRHRVSDGCPSHPLLTMAQSFGRGTSYGTTVGKCFGTAGWCNARVPFRQNCHRPSTTTHSRLLDAAPLRGPASSSRSGSRRDQCAV